MEVLPHVQVIGKPKPSRRDGRNGQRAEKTGILGKGQEKGVLKSKE